jgi:hypothetical protein
MSETKFTSGEWEVIGLSVHSYGRGEIARCPLPNVGGVFECSTNARLIAAAPDLYATLAEIRQWMDAEMGAWDAKFIAQIDALLSRARGEQP